MLLFKYTTSYIFSMSDYSSDPLANAELSDPSVDFPPIQLPLELSQDECLKLIRSNYTGSLTLAQKNFLDGVSQEYNSTDVRRRHILYNFLSGTGGIDNASWKVLKGQIKNPTVYSLNRAAPEQ